MDITTFVASVREPGFFTTKKMICFSGSSYPLLFFSWLFRYVALEHGIVFQALDGTLVDAQKALSRLQMGFLGQASYYWLRDLGEYGDKDSKHLVKYMRMYEGPNTILFFTTSVPTGWDQHQVVTLPEVVDKKLFCTLALFEGDTFAKRNSVIIQALFSAAPCLPLDGAYAMLRYLHVIGNNQNLFIDHMIPVLVGPEKSLFTLSQYFFAKQATPFFQLWASCEADYGEIFWITFWSEQVWRTYSYVYLMRQNKVAEAKSIAYRLPFSVLQRDWKKLSLSELQRAHNFLYELDHAAKNGSMLHGLDLFYTQFFISLQNDRAE